MIWKLLRATWLQCFRSAFWLALTMFTHSLMWDMLSICFNHGFFNHVTEEIINWSIILAISRALNWHFPCLNNLIYLGMTGWTVFKTLLWQHYGWLFIISFLCGTTCHVISIEVCTKLILDTDNGVGRNRAFHYKITWHKL